MNWEDLSGNDFEKAIIASKGVCLVPLSCIERHAHHLPLGTDMFIARELCKRAALEEEVVIFPDMYLTQILEAKHCLGTIALNTDLILELLQNICAEIARNGFKKIMLVNAHGGNWHFLQFFAQSQLNFSRDYVIYLVKPYLKSEDQQTIRGQWQSSVDGHAGENETSQIMVIRPDLVHYDMIFDDNEGMPLERLKAITKVNLYTGIWWYADHPSHFRGNAQKATKEKGENIIQAKSKALVEAIRTVKEDIQTPKLQSEFFNFTTSPKSYSKG